jgi:hypothetical protein
MKTYSIIDNGKRDFIRDSDGKPAQIKADSEKELYEWLKVNKESEGWVNKGIQFIKWPEAGE